MAKEPRLTKRQAISRLIDLHGQVEALRAEIERTTAEILKNTTKALDQIQTGIETLIGELPNRSPSRRAPRSSRQIDEHTRARVLKLAEDEGLSQHQIATILGVNQGRISEILVGRRHDAAD